MPACSRRIVGRYLAAQIPAELVLNALGQALTPRQPAPELLIHADWGSQYSSHACRQRSEEARALARYSRLGNLHNNAQAEAGWSTLKTDLPPDGAVFASLEAARFEVAYYLLLQPRPPTLRPRCIVPECDGVPFEPAIRQKLWDKYFTAAPVQLRQYDAVSNVVRKASKR